MWKCHQCLTVVNKSPPEFHLMSSTMLLAGAVIKFPTLKGCFSPQENWHGSIYFSFLFATQRASAPQAKLFDGTNPFHLSIRNPFVNSKKQRCLCHVTDSPPCCHVYMFLMKRSMKKAGFSSFPPPTHTHTVLNEKLQLALIKISFFFFWGSPACILRVDFSSG